MRQELHREYGGLKCRLVEHAQIGALPLVCAMEGLDASSEEAVNNDAKFKRALTACRGSGCPCCIGSECSEVNRYLGTDANVSVPIRKLRALKHAYKLWKGMILSAERACAGNQMRAVAEFKKVRSVRRQFATVFW